jgi:AcrR family transcriptional regulator
MKIVGFPIDMSRSQDGYNGQSRRTRETLIQSTLDLVQAGDVEPTATAIAAIAGVSNRTLFQHFGSLADLYVAAFDLAVSRVFDRNRPIDNEAPLSNRIELLVSDRSELCERWLPVWHFAKRVRSVAPAVGLGVVHLRKVLRERLAAWFATELGSLDSTSRDLVLNSLDSAFGLDSWMDMRKKRRLSPIHASRIWRFTAEAIEVCFTAEAIEVLRLGVREGRGSLAGVR